MAMQVDIPSPHSPGFSPHVYHLTQTIDDVVYRYSAESDRGTPREGIYARDGLWDDDELSSDATTIRPSSGSTFGHHSSRRQSRPGPTPPASTKSRSRSGTVISAARSEEKGGMWTWGRKASTSTTLMPAPTPVPEARAEVVQQPKGLEKKKSKSLLRGKGRRGELSVNVSPGDPDESFEAPPPLPPTPASFVTHSSPALSTASMITPSSYPSRLDTATPETPGLDKGPKSSWRRGMKKIFKSKSSVALREAFANVDTNRPALPQGGLPSKPTHQTLGKPFSSSTPPMPFAPPKTRDTMWSFYSNSPLSPPASAMDDSFGLPSHPSLPADPFASSLDLSSNRIPQSPLASPALPPKARLSRNSPSLRDLKQFLSSSKPSLTKAKSLANIREKAALPASAPPTKTEFPHNKTVKRVHSVVLGSTRNPEASVEEEPVRPALLRPTLSRIPTESPPLLPPNPPYFPTSFLPTKSGLSTPSSMALSIDTSVGSPSLDNPPPTSPLPALPSSSPLSPLGSATVPIKRSGSSAVLLPRSRSTSMSLKAPPTSSSFFDLYEQLGIWPTPSDKDTASPEKSPETKTKELQSPIDAGTRPTLTVSQSPSATFSAASWEAAISAFPLVDEIPPPNSMSMDFGQPEMADHDLHIAPAPYTSYFDDEGDVSMSSNIAVEGSTCSLSNHDHDSSQRAVQENPSDTIGSKAYASTGYSKASLGLGPIRNGGSSNSSGSPSRDERRRGPEGKWFDGKSGRSSQSSSDDEDDEPLSKLHPDAHVVQQQAAVKRRATRKAAKARAKGRNPGGDIGWDGEGGVPADALRMKLESMLLTKEMRVYNWQLSQGHAVASSSGQRTQTYPTRGLRPARSFTDPHRTKASVPVVHRSHTVKRDSARTARPMMAPPVSMMVAPIGGPPPMPTTQATGPSRHGTLRRPDAYGQTRASHEPSFSHLSRIGSSSTTSSDHHSHHAAVPPMPNVTRSNTAATSRSSASRSRSRAMSNAASTQQPESMPHARAVTEPIPQRKQQAMSADAFIGGLSGRRVVLEVYPETTARDVLQASRSRSELPELASGTNWVVMENFAELGYERQIREYEPLQAVVKGWDPSGPFNCFIFRQSNNATSTWTRSIPMNAPFLGAYVQYETKKGKWSKRFLETRGGQVFVSKNDKNKEEMQINTLFHDVHTITRAYNSPKPFVFVMKRVEPASAFENPNDYLHVFSAEESIGWKLLAAIYDAKSHALAQSKPQLLIEARQAIHHLPPVKPEGPFIDLKEEPVEKSAFTGKGLLRI